MGIGSKLLDIINERNTNVNELSIIANVSPNTLYSIIKRDNTKMDIDTLIKISRALNVPVEYFSDDVFESIQKEKLVSTIQLTPDEEEHITKYRNLSDDVKSAIDVIVDAAAFKKE